VPGNHARVVWQQEEGLLQNGVGYSSGAGRVVWKGEEVARQKVVLKMCGAV